MDARARARAIARVVMRVCVCLCFGKWVRGSVCMCVSVCGRARAQVMEKKTKRI